MRNERARHWDAAYAARGAHGVSWYQQVPTVSLELIETLGVGPSTPVLDVGGGASTLADALVGLGYHDVTVLDTSSIALQEVGARLVGGAVTLVQGDVLAWRPERRYGLWHDRATFHFLVEPADRERYLACLRTAIGPGDAIVMGTFARDAPPSCSGLPVVRYEVDELAALLGSAFELVEARREEHRTPRGVLQPFTWVAGRLHAS